jgi:Divergent InlB B-repeat domain
VSRVLVAATAALGLLVLTTSAVAVPDMALHATVSVEKVGSGSGTVVSSPAGIDCGDICSFSFISNDDPENYQPVTLTATPDPGSEFEGFEGCCPIELAPGRSYGVRAFFGRARPTMFPLRSP